MFECHMLHNFWILFPTVVGFINTMKTRPFKITILWLEMRNALYTQVCVKTITRLGLVTWSPLLSNPRKKVVACFSGGIGKTWNFVLWSPLHKQPDRHSVLRINAVILRSYNAFMPYVLVVTTPPNCLLDSWTRGIKGNFAALSCFLKYFIKLLLR